GGVSAAFVQANLPEEFAAGTCLSFGPGTPLEGADSWDGLCARLPEGWRPQAVVFHFAYQTFPFGAGWFPSYRHSCTASGLIRTLNDLEAMGKEGTNSCAGPLTASCADGLILPDTNPRSPKDRDCRHSKTHSEDLGEGETRLLGLSGHSRKSLSCTFVPRA